MKKKTIMPNDLTTLATAFPLVAFDIGARGGLKDDLSAIANGVDYVLFEPDEDAYATLKSRGGGSNCRSWKAVNFGLAGTDTSFMLKLYRRRGCSSKLEADQELANIFSRGDYYIHDGDVEVAARSIDSLIETREIPDPHFIKIDVQGMESEIFAGATEAMNRSVVGVRTEVSFAPLYRSQPLFSEIELQLRPYHLVPMGWLESHSWRRLSRAKFPRRSKGQIPASRGQLIHADVLFLSHPEALPHQSDGDLEALARLGLIAAAYGYFDHAAAAFTQGKAREFMMERTGGLDPVDVLTPLAKRLTRYGLFAAILAGLDRRLARLMLG